MFMCIWTARDCLTAFDSPRKLFCWEQVKTPKKNFQKHFPTIFIVTFLKKIALSVGKRKMLLVYFYRCTIRTRLVLRIRKLIRKSESSVWGIPVIKENVDGTTNRSWLTRYTSAGHENVTNYCCTEVKNEREPHDTTVLRTSWDG